MKNSTYFIVFLVLVMIGVGSNFVVDILFPGVLSAKYWFVFGGVLAMYIWSKEDFTDKPWFSEKEIILEREPEPELEYLEVTDEEREGLMVLFEHCVPNLAIRNELIVMLDGLQDAPNYDEEWFGTPMDAMLYTIDYCNEEMLSFIISLDVKEGVEEFLSCINESLSKLFDVTIDNLPKKVDYSDRYSACSTTVFKDVDKVLRGYGLQLGGIDIGGDNNNLFIHKEKDRGIVQSAIGKMGYPYYEL